MKKLSLSLLIVGGLWWWFSSPSIEVKNGAVKFHYLVKYTGGASSNEMLPMLIALHGDGDTPKHFFKTALDVLDVPARVIVIQAPRRYGSGYMWPNRSSDLILYGDGLNEAIEKLQSQYSTIGKPIVMGFSGGAVMAFYLGLAHGDNYSYIFPISGILPIKDKVRPAKGTLVKVYAYHGKHDELVAPQGSINAVKRLKDNQIKAKLTIFKGTHHGIFLNMKKTINNHIGDKLREISH